MAVVRPKKTPTVARTKREGAGEPALPKVRVLTEQEAWDMYDARARSDLGISADEFEAALARGEYSGPIEDVDAESVRMLRTSRPQP